VSQVTEARPAPGEHHPYYATYIDRVDDGDILETLTRLESETATFLAAVPPERETRRYRQGAWSVREVVGHLIDSERLFGFRALHIARGDPAALPSMDQELWARSAAHNDRPLADLAEELRLLRRGHLRMIRGFPEAAWSRRGVASGRDFTVRALVWILAGHEIHHLRVLEERYGLGHG